MAAILEGTYDPQQVIVTVGGVILSGFNDGDAIVAKRNEDSSSMKVGIDGTVARAINANKSGTFEFDIKQSSPANTQLGELFGTGDLENEGWATVGITVTDGSGSELATASQAWLKSVPELSFGKDIGSRKWIFDCADLRISF